MSSASQKTLVFEYWESKILVCQFSYAKPAISWSCPTVPYKTNTKSRLNGGISVNSGQMLYCWGLHGEIKGQSKLQPLRWNTGETQLQLKILPVKSGIHGGVSLSESSCHSAEQWLRELVQTLSFQELLLQGYSCTQTHRVRHNYHKSKLRSTTQPVGLNHHQKARTGVVTWIAKMFVSRGRNYL